VLVLDEAVVIKRPRSVVFEFFTTAMNVTRWAKNVTEFDLVAGKPREAGAIMRGVAKVAGRRLPFSVELLEIELGRRTVERSQDAKIPYTMEMGFEDVGEDATKVSWHQEAEAFFPPLLRLADPLALKIYARDVRANLANAKKLLETSQPVGADGRQQ
jgi:hypothetical protein